VEITGVEIADPESVCIHVERQFPEDAFERPLGKLYVPSATITATSFVVKSTSGGDLSTFTWTVMQ
jgi:hypothetical protein